MAINPDDFSPAIIMDCQIKQATSVELSPDEKQRRITDAAEHELNEQQKAAQKAAADDALRLLAGNPNASVKAADLLAILLQLGIDPAALMGQTKSG